MRLSLWNSWIYGKTYMWMDTGHAWDNCSILEASARNFQFPVLGNLPWLWKSAFLLLSCDGGEYGWFPKFGKALGSKSGAQKRCLLEIKQE
jgi:hypothetical protein